MPSLLLIDDDPDVLEVMRRGIARRLPSWEVAVAADASEAFAALGERGFDVVLSDVTMSGLDGAQVMHRVRETHPDAVRILMSGFADQETRLRSAAVAHQFLAKPFDLSALSGVLERTGVLRTLLQRPQLRELTSSLGEIPSAPTVYIELTDALAQPFSSVSDIVAIIGRDVGMAAQTLRLARGAYFGPSSDSLELPMAVARLGFGLLRGLVLSAGTYRSFQDAEAVPGFDIRAEQEHAMAVSRVARQLRVPGADPDETSVAGLLHDAGRLVLAARRPDLMHQVLEQARTEHRDPTEVELEVLGATHAELGAYLLGLWGLPAGVISAVSAHHHPETSTEAAIPLTASLHVANAVVRARATGQPPAVDHAWLARVGLADQLDDWLRNLEDEPPAA